MTTGQFDESCPHCSRKVGVYDAFMASDYEHQFSFECNSCGKWIAVDVHTVPEFELSKPDDIDRVSLLFYGILQNNKGSEA